MSVPSPSLQPSPYGVKGIQYYPIASSTLSPPSTGIGHIGVTEKAFSFASSGQPSPYDYLTVNLLEYSNPTLTLGYGTRDVYPPSAVIVKGHIMALPNGDYGTDIDEIDSVYFEHVFLTDWFSSSISELISPLYSFEDQPPSENAALDWIPSNGWVNGVSCINGSPSDWDPNSSLSTKGWNLGDAGTPSTSTGPNGGVNIFNNNIPGGTSSGVRRYIYGETSQSGSVSSEYYIRRFIARTPSFNFTTLMDDPVNNDLILRFYVHGFGADIGNLTIGVSQFPTETSSSLTQLAYYPEDSWPQNSTTDAYTKIDLSLPGNIKQANTDWYFYFVYNKPNGSFNGDLAVDSVGFYEQYKVPNYTSNFYHEIASGNNGTLIPDASPSVQFDWDGSPTGNANVTFTLDTINGAYIKGTYLLM